MRSGTSAIKGATPLRTVRMFSAFRLNAGIRSLAEGQHHQRHNEQAGDQSACNMALLVELVGSNRQPLHCDCRNLPTELKADTQQPQNQNDPEHCPKHMRLSLHREHPSLTLFSECTREFET